MSQKTIKLTTLYPVLSWSGLKAKFQCFKFNLVSPSLLLQSWGKGYYYCSYPSRHPHFFIFEFQRYKNLYAILNWRKNFVKKKEKKKKQSLNKKTNLIYNFFYSIKNVAYYYLSRYIFLSSYFNLKNHNDLLCSRDFKIRQWAPW